MKSAFRLPYLPLSSCLLCSSLLHLSLQLSILWSRSMLYGRSVTLKSWKLSASTSLLIGWIFLDKVSHFPQPVFLQLILRKCGYWTVATVCSDVHRFDLVGASLRWFHCPFEMILFVFEIFLDFWHYKNPGFILYLPCHWTRSWIGHFSKNLWSVSDGGIKLKART